MWLEMIVDNLQAGKSCEPHNIQSNIQEKCEEEEGVPEENIFDDFPNMSQNRHLECRKKLIITISFM